MLAASHAGAQETPPAESAADAPSTRSGYLGAGALYLPVDKGLTAAAIYGGTSVGASDHLEYGYGGRLGYGESRYSRALTLMPEGHVLHWWGSYGLGLAVGLGAVVASKKTPSGWDGVHAGGMVTASPVRLRFERVEVSVDLGAVLALGEDDLVAPFLMPAVTYWF